MSRLAAKAPLLQSGNRGFESHLMYRYAIASRQYCSEDWHLSHERQAGSLARLFGMHYFLGES